MRFRDFMDRPVILFFYPHDFTPVCTRESCAFRDEYEGIRATGAEVLGISGDAPTRHAAFAKRHAFPFPLLSDVDGSVRRLYGVRPFLGVWPPGRETFVIDAEGTIRARFRSQFRGRAHAEQALEVLRGLQTPQASPARGP